MDGRFRKCVRVGANVPPPPSTPPNTPAASKNAMGENAYGYGACDLYEILQLAMETFAPSAAMEWYVDRDPYLGYSRPCEVLFDGGKARVLAALRARQSGAKP